MGRLALFGVTLALLVPWRVEAVVCTGSQLAYAETGNSTQSFPLCSGITCQTPVLGSPTYSAAPGCDPTVTTCAVTATVNTEFPGNHQNNPAGSGFAYSYGTVECFHSVAR